MKGSTDEIVYFNFTSLPGGGSGIHRWKILGELFYHINCLQNSGVKVYLGLIKRNTGEPMKAFIDTIKGDTYVQLEASICYTYKLSKKIT